MMFALPPALVAGEYVRLPTRARVVALTLDAGGNVVGAGQVLSVVRGEHVRPTFFVTGEFARQYPTLTRAMARSGVIANHTWDHAALPGLSSPAVRQEVVRAAGELRRLTGQNPRPLFRFPYGSRDARTLRIVRSLGYVSIRWTVDTLGWMGRSARRGAVARVVEHLEPGAILLMHVGAARDGSTVDAHVLRAVIRAVERRGYRFVTLDAYFHRR
jgi:peptidoglycan/xylan/chitin deacetylase (PgdA/CDA1 family)